jgi:type IV pilus assembly protein PilO
VASNLTLSKLPWYGQVGLFVLLSAASVFVFWNFYAKPAQASLETRRAQLTKLEAEIRTALASAQRGNAFKQEVASLEAQLMALRAVLPEEQDVADLLNRVQEMANESRLSIRGFTPQTVARRSLHAEYPYTLQLEGTYHDLGDFLERVSKFARIINVGGMRIRTREQQPPGGPTITVDCTATTFVLLEAPPAPAPGASSTPPPSASAARPAAAPAGA